LGIGLVVDIRLGITISATPQTQQEAFEWLYQTQQQVTQESAQSTTPYLTPEEAAEIKWVPEWKDVPMIIGFIGSMFLKNPFWDSLLGKEYVSVFEAAERIAAGETPAILALEGAKISWLRKIVEISKKPIDTASRLFSLVLAPFSIFVNLAIVSSMAKTPLFWFDPDLWMDNYLNVYLPDLKPSLLLIKNRIPEIYKKVEEISEKVAPLTEIPSKIDQLPKEIEKIKITPEEIDQKLKPRFDLFFQGLYLTTTSLNLTAQSLTLLQNSLTSAETSIKNEVKTQTQSVPSQIIPELSKIKTQLEFSIPDNVLGRIAQGLTTIDTLKKGFSVFAEVAQDLLFGDVGKTWFNSESALKLKYLGGYGVGLNFILPYDLILSVGIARNDIGRAQFFVDFRGGFE
jgi:hypothetical protein